MQFTVARKDDEPIDEAAIEGLRDRYGKEHVYYKNGKIVFINLSLTDSLNLVRLLKKWNYVVTTDY